MKSNFLLLFWIMILALQACNPTALAGNSVGPSSWFDAPLDGSVYPLGPVEITSHSSDPSGIAMVEFSYNESIFSTLPSSDSKKSLVVMEQTWYPPDPGHYTLRVRAQNKAGAWGSYTMVDITIGGGVVQGVVYADLDGNGDITTGEDPLGGVDVTLSGCGPNLSQATGLDGQFQFSMLPAGSCLVQAYKAGWAYSGAFPDLGYPVPVASDPTLPTSFSLYMTPSEDVAPEEIPAPSPTPTPTPATIPQQQTADIAIERVSTEVVYMRGGGCGPKEVSFTVNAFDPVGITAVVLFYRAQDQSSDEGTEWRSQAMNPAGEDLFSLSLKPETDIFDGAGSIMVPDASWWLNVQVVLQNINDDTSTRTQVHSEVSIEVCTH